MTRQEPYEVFIRRMERLAAELDETELTLCYACDKMAESPTAITVDGKRYCCPDCYRPT